MWGVLKLAASLITGYFAERKAKQDTRLTLHKMAQTATTVNEVNDTALRITQLTTFNNNVLRDFCFLLIMVPYVVLPFCPDCVHNFFESINRDIPMWYQSLTISMMAAVWGWGKFIEYKRLP